MVLNLGDKAPDFKLKSTNGSNISLESLMGNKTILYFYPKDDTPGCTIEACEFRDSNEELQNLNVTVLGVSPDDEESHKQFTDKFDLNFPLLADPGSELAKTYGAWGERERQGKIIVGIIRTTFAIDENGYISNIWPQVSPEGHAKEIIDWVKEN
mgnify:FL=1